MMLSSNGILRFLGLTLLPRLHTPLCLNCVRLTSNAQPCDQTPSLVKALRVHMFKCLLHVSSYRGDQLRRRSSKIVVFRCLRSLTSGNVAVHILQTCPEKERADAERRAPPSKFCSCYVSLRHLRAQFAGGRGACVFQNCRAFAKRHHLGSLRYTCGQH